MNKQLFIFFLSASLTAFGQSEINAPRVEFKRFAIGVSFSPDIAYQRPDNLYDVPEESWETQKEIFYNLYKPRAGFTTGALVSFNLSRRWSLETGAQYSLKGYRQKPGLGAIMFGGEVQYQGQIKQHANFEFLDVPLAVNYVVLDRRLQIVATAGVAWNYMLHNSLKWFVHSDEGREWVSPITAHTPHTTSTFSLTGGLGVQYKFNGTVMLKAVPTFRYALFPTHTNLSESGNHWNAGLNVSCYVSLF